MKVGSIVEILPGYLSVYTEITIRKYIKWFPKYNTPYTIRKIEYDADEKVTLVALEENALGYFPSSEIGISIKYVRELLPPIENIEEHINENIAEEVLCEV